MGSHYKFFKLCNITGKWHSIIMPGPDTTTFLLFYISHSWWRMAMLSMLADTYLFLNQWTFVLERVQVPSSCSLLPYAYGILLYHSVIKLLSLGYFVQKPAVISYLPSKWSSLTLATVKHMVFLVAIFLTQLSSTLLNLPPHQHLILLTFMYILHVCLSPHVSSCIILFSRCY